MRQALVDEGVLQLLPNQTLYEFQSDYIFTSPSYAAASVAGGEENGRVQWKYKGKSLNQLESEAIE